jgi:hypothetical protein
MWKIIAYITTVLDVEVISSIPVTKYTSPTNLKATFPKNLWNPDDPSRCCFERSSPSMIFDLTTSESNPFYLHSLKIYDFLLIFQPTGDSLVGFMMNK